MPERGYRAIGWIGIVVAVAVLALGTRHQLTRPGCWAGSAGHCAADGRALTLIGVGLLLALASVALLAGLTRNRRRPHPQPQPAEPLPPVLQLPESEPEPELAPGVTETEAEQLAAEYLKPGVPLTGLTREQIAAVLKVAGVHARPGSRGPSLNRSAGAGSDRSEQESGEPIPSHSCPADQLAAGGS